MKILGKNVYIGKKCICTEFTNVIDDISTLEIHEKSHKGIVLEDDVIFVEDKQGNFVDVLDTEHIGSIALKVYGAAPRWPNKPLTIGQKYVEIKPYFNSTEQESAFDLKFLISIASHIKDENNLSHSLQ